MNGRMDGLQHRPRPPSDSGHRKAGRAVFQPGPENPVRALGGCHFNHAAFQVGPCAAQRGLVVSDNPATFAVENLLHGTSGVIRLQGTGQVADQALPDALPECPLVLALTFRRGQQVAVTDPALPEGPLIGFAFEGHEQPKDFVSACPTGPEGAKGSGGGTDDGTGLGGQDGGGRDAGDGGGPGSGRGTGDRGTCTGGGSGSDDHADSGSSLLGGYSLLGRRLADGGTRLSGGKLIFDALAVLTARHVFMVSPVSDRGPPGLRPNTPVI